MSCLLALTVSGLSLTSHQELGFQKGDDDEPLAPLRAWSSDVLPADVRAIFTNGRTFWGAFQTVVDDDVFTRAWIYQEIVTSGQVFLLGTAVRLSWGVFAKAFQILQRLEAEWSDDWTRFSAATSLELIMHDRAMLLAGKCKD
jgi:hypothetical protein